VLALKYASIVLTLKKVSFLLYEALGDWYSGRYIRQTYTHLEKLYIAQYEMPALARSTGRFAISFFLNLILAQLAALALADVMVLSPRNQRVCAGVFLGLQISTSALFSAFIGPQTSTPISVQLPPLRQQRLNLPSLPPSLHFIRLVRKAKVLPRLLLPVTLPLRIIRVNLLHITAEPKLFKPSPPPPPPARPRGGAGEVADALSGKFCNLLRRLWGAGSGASGGAGREEADRAALSASRSRAAGSTRVLPIETEKKVKKQKGTKKITRGAKTTKTDEVLP
jgi:hypothetical protein